MQTTLEPPRLSAEEELYWLALLLTPGLGCRTANALVQRFRSVQRVFQAQPEELEDCGISGAVARTIASGCTFEDAAAQQALLRKHGAGSSR